MRKFAISDIHGCRATFIAMLDRLAFSQGDQLFLLGDYVDRGPDSKGVLDLIFKLINSGYTIHCLRGNHEQLVLRAQEDQTGLDNWLLTDGKKTMDSFRVDDIRKIPAYYLAFMDSLPLYAEVDGYLLVHAGLNFKLFDPLGDAWSLLTIRHWHEDMRYDWLGERIVLHGHTPITRPTIELLSSELDRYRYLNIDCGCVYADPSFKRDNTGLGYLCAFDMTNREVVFQENVEP